MNRSPLLVLGFLLISPAAFGQASSTDSQTLQALLAEVRQLRQDLHRFSVAAQRVQILFHRLQGQEATVALMQRRVDEARSNLEQTQSEMKSLSSAIKQTEEKLTDAQNPDERKRLEGLLSKIKAELEVQQGVEQRTLTRQAEVEQDLRNEQAMLDALRDQLDQLDKSLEGPNR